MLHSHISTLRESHLTKFTNFKQFILSYLYSKGKSELKCMLQHKYIRAAFCFHEDIKVKYNESDLVEEMAVVGRHGFRPSSCWDHPSILMETCQYNKT